MLTIPRFGSTRASDPDYDPVLARIGRGLVVRVDGQRVHFPIAYNVDQGWVRALRSKPKDLSPTGTQIPLMHRGVALEETLVGRVTVR